MKKFMFSLMIVAVLAVVVAFPVAASYTISPRLLAGQNQFAGVVKFTGDADFLTVTFMMRSGAGWCLEETHVHVGTSLDDFPQNSGGVIPGQFDYKASHNCERGFTFEIPVQPEWYGNTIFVATHAVVTGPDGQQETAWAVNCGNLEGGQFPGSNWSAFFMFPANAWY